MRRISRPGARTVEACKAPCTAKEADVKIRLRVACTLGAAGDVVDTEDRSALKLLARRVADPLGKAKGKAKPKKAKTPKED